MLLSSIPVRELNDQNPCEAFSLPFSSRNHAGTSVEYDSGYEPTTSLPNHWTNCNNGPGAGNGRPMMLKIPKAAPCPFVFPSNRSATYPTVRYFTFSSSSYKTLKVSGQPCNSLPLG